MVQSGRSDLSEHRDWRTGFGAWLGQPFEVSPEPRQALALSTGLWGFVFFLTSVFNILAGYVHVLGEYLTLLWGVATGVGVAWGLYLVFRVLAGRQSWLAVLVLTPAILAAGVVQMWADYGGQFVMNSFFEGMVLPDSSWTSRTKVALVYVSIYATNAALFWVTFSSRRVREQQQMIADREAAALRAELRVLRLQLNPHFMFNALSALSTLILTKRNLDAEEMTDKLSEFLRAAMDVDALKDIRLTEELAIMDAYLAVENVRFGDRLALVIDCEPDAEAALVPNLLLQPLVENAMKYAVEPSTAPVTVRIRARRLGPRLRLEVLDSGAVVRKGGARASAGHGLGLAAVGQRLKLGYGDAASVTAEARPPGFAVTIEMPFRTASG